MSAIYEKLEEYLGHKLTVLEKDGDTWFSGSEIGRALEYPDHGLGLVKLLKSEAWFMEGKHYFLIPVPSPVHGIKEVMALSRFGLMEVITQCREGKGGITKSGNAKRMVLFNLIEAAMSAAFEFAPDPSLATGNTKHLITMNEKGRLDIKERAKLRR